MRHGNIGNIFSGLDDVGGRGGTGVPAGASGCAFGHAAFVDPTASTPSHRQPTGTS
jgi:hypothetical protein